MTSVQRPSRCEGLEVNQVADGLVVYQAAPEQVHYLNNTSAVIFELCEGHRSIEEIAEQVQDVFSLPAPPVDEVKAWQARPLESVWPIVYLDALVLKIRDQGVVALFRNKRKITRSSPLAYSRPSTNRRPPSGDMP